MTINGRAHPKESRHDCSSPLTVIINQVRKDPIHNYTDFPWHAFDALTLMHNLYNHTQLRQNATEPLPGGGGACSQDPLTFLDFIPCSPLLKPLVPKNDFSSCSLDPQNYCAVPLIPRNFYPCSLYLFTCFTFLFMVKEIAF